MNLSQLEINLEAVRLTGDRVETVHKAVEYANACQQVRKYETAIACLNKILPEIQDDSGLHAIIKTALGTAYWEKAQLQKALDHFQEALAVFEQAGDRSGKAAILSIVGITFWRKCDWTKALEILKDALGQQEDGEKDIRFASLFGALDRGIITLQNRIRLGQELDDRLKVLQPLFSSTALYLITGNKVELKSSLDESVLLAEQLNKTDILEAAIGLKKLMD